MKIYQRLIDIFFLTALVEYGSFHKLILFTIDKLFFLFKKKIPKDDKKNQIIKSKFLQLVLRINTFHLMMINE